MSESSQDEPVLVAATIEGAELVVKSNQGEAKKFHIREIANIELEHVVPPGPFSSGHPDNIRAYIGHRDTKKRSTLAPRSVTRTFVGSFSDTRKFDAMRKTFATVGAPVIEF